MTVLDYLQNVSLVPAPGVPVGLPVKLSAGHLNDAQKGPTRARTVLVICDPLTSFRRRRVHDNDEHHERMSASEVPSPLAGSWTVGVDRLARGSRPFALLPFPPSFSIHASCKARKESNEGGTW